MRRESFGESSVGPVQVLTIGSEPRPALEVLDLGATVHRLWVSDGHGVRRNVVLGHATPGEYLASDDYIGGTIGRYANRIKGGRFPLDGEEVQLATNERGNTLHGGPEGFDRQVWEVVEHLEDRLTLTLESPDGDQGFPGHVTATVSFSTTEDSVRVLLGAVTDAPTVVGLTSHAYFNLDGDGSGPVDEQLLCVHASEYLTVDNSGIPLVPAPVEGTAFDLREPTRLAPRIAESGGFDHNFVLEGAGRRLTATLDSPATRTRLELLADQPGLQVYTGGGLDGSRRSTTGQPYRAGDGLALEPQVFPDTPNRPEFGSAVLRPGETYTSLIEWRFSTLGHDGEH
ncbi:MAG: galactose mutarotase [Marmoricola sp.]|nr:galactose mutarotase [Marmoricola sp.]